MNSRRRVLLAAFAAAALEAHGQPATPMAMREGGPAVIPNSSTFDFRSSINGRQYRLFVSLPPGFDFQKRYGVLYVLDGNQYFGTASEAVARQSFLKTISPVIVVGIGYPSAEFATANTERWFDLTHQATIFPEIKNNTGGGKDFQKVVLDEVRPFI